MMNYLRNTNQRFRTALIAVIFAVVLVVITCTLLGMATPTSGTDKAAETDTHTQTSSFTPYTEQTTPEVKELEIISLGEYRLTAYCGCSKCCGKWGENRPLDENGKPIVYTANMSIAKEGVTVAADINVLPYGTKVIIDGHEYIVQDRGGVINGNRIDIYFESHQDALNFGVQYKEIYTERNESND